MQKGSGGTIDVTQGRGGLLHLVHSDVCMCGCPALLEGRTYIVTTMSCRETDGSAMHVTLFLHTWISSNCPKLESAC